MALRLEINGGGYLESGDRLNMSIGLDVCASHPLSGCRAHNSSLKTLKLFVPRRSGRLESNKRN